MHVDSDIQSRDDIAAVVRDFYTRLFADDELGPIFVDIVKMDLDAHMPIMCDFWETVLFGRQVYRGGMMAVHFQVHLLAPLTRMHFQRWVDYWEATIDDHFAGERANYAKVHANRVANSLSGRLSGLSNAGGRG